MLKSVRGPVSGVRRFIRADESVTGVLIRAVSDVKERDPVELAPLADEVNPDCLDSLFESTTRCGAQCLELCYEGCRVTVDPEAVTVEEA